MYKWNNHVWNWQLSKQEAQLLQSGRARSVSLKIYLRYWMSFDIEQRCVCKFLSVAYSIVTVSILYRFWGFNVE